MDCPWKEKDATVSNELMASGEHDLNLLAAYVENRLDDAERARVAAHLASCVECRTTLAAYVRGSSPAAESPTLPGAPHQWFRRPAVWLPVAAMMMLTTVVILSLLRPGGTGGPSSESAGGTRSGNQAIQAPSGAAERIVEGKRFRLVAGEWIDESHDPLAARREIEVRSPEQRNALLQRIPALRAFAALGNRVIVVHEGTVYKFGTDPLQ